MTAAEKKDKHFKTATKFHKSLFNLLFSIIICYLLTKKCIRHIIYIILRFALRVHCSAQF